MRIGVDLQWASAQNLTNELEGSTVLCVGIPSRPVCCYPESMSVHSYSIAILKNAACPILGADFDRVLSRAPLTDEARETVDYGVSDKDFITIWESIIDAAGDTYDPIFLGRMMANGPVIPVFLAFSCAPNLATGLKRFARYKAIFGPIVLRIEQTKRSLKVDILSEGDNIQLPASMVIPFAVFMVEKARSHSARHLTPKRIAFPSGVMDGAIAAAYFGITPGVARICSIEFTAHDMFRPFISENTKIWREIELDLNSQLLGRNHDLAFNIQVETAIRTALYGGEAHVEAICRQLGTSRSTLQRRLSTEGFTFQQIFDRVRSDLATRYLTKSDFSVVEISNMVGFKDPKSFHRAFRKWFGQTPMEYRADHRI
ncbi:MAG: helix-turn-helix domain-containing protein [Pseudomonadota bacterium]